MKRILLSLTVFLALLLAGGAQAQRGSGVGWVRFGHASTDAEEVTVLVNGDDWITDSTFGTIYLYAPFEVGDYEMDFEVGNRDYDGDLVFEFEVEEGQTYTILVTGSVDENTLRSVLYPENEYVEDEAYWETYSHLMIVNAMDDDSGFDIVDTNDRDNVWFEVRDLNIISYIFLNGEWDLNVTEPGNEDEIIIEDLTGDIDFPAGGGFRYMFIISGSARRPEVTWSVGGHRTINQVLIEEFPIMSDVVAEVGLDDAFDTETYYTLFAPTDDAFENFADDNNMDVEDIFRDRGLEDILNYHVMENYNTMAFLADAGRMDSISGERLEFDLDRDGWLIVNDVTVTRWIPALNGVLYEIDEVLTP